MSAGSPNRQLGSKVLTKSMNSDSNEVRIRCLFRAVVLDVLRAKRADTLDVQAHLERRVKQLQANRDKPETRSSSSDPLTATLTTA